MLTHEELDVQANLVFLYYKDLASAQDFYANTLGLEMVVDYGFAKLFRISQTTYVGLIDEQRGMHKSTEPKTVTLSFVTEEIDEWYTYLIEKGVKMRGEVGDAARHPTRGFVAYDQKDISWSLNDFSIFPKTRNSSCECLNTNRFILHVTPNRRGQKILESRRTSSGCIIGILLQHKYFTRMFWASSC